jgi:protein involved in polysaccharide export with SLBB domain
MLVAKTCRFRFGFAALLCAALCGGVVSAQESQSARSHYAYHIGTGDVLQISVYQHPELSGAVLVRASGDINLPWHKAAKVAGLSVEATSDLLRRELQSVVGWPCVTLTVKKRNGSWVREKEPYFIDVPSPSQSYATRMRDS